MNKQPVRLEKNKCELCALKVVFDQDRLNGDDVKVENYMTLLRELQEENIIEPGYKRRVFVSNTGDGDKSEMCAVNSEFFAEKKDEKCPHFILNMELTVDNALSLHTARNTDKLTRSIHHMTILILLLTAVAAVTSITATFINESQAIQAPMPTQSVAPKSLPSKSP